MEVKDKTKEQVERETGGVQQLGTNMKEDKSSFTRAEESCKDGSPYLMVVDDASFDVELLTDILTRRGYKVRAFSNGRQALNSVADEAPDLILMDVKMPDMDGYEVCRRLKSDKQSSGIPVIFVSALDQSEDEIEGFIAGGVDYITKPFQTAQILARVDTHLTLRRMQKELEAQNTRLQQEIAERRQVESIMQARLRLLEFANSHSMDEFLTATLDEIEALTGSTIGFYHFLESDQKTLSLQNWSTNTLKNMCTSEGKGSHYGIARAGVWVDCVYERRPVIHNDYASLPHRKGMPEGHAPVAREVVIPIFRGNLIKAIIGVGNKSTNYDERDIGIVSQLGDLSWDITERKQAEEKLKKSEENYRTLVENLNVGVYRNTGGPHGQFIQANSAIARMFGYDSVDEFMKINVSVLYHDPDDRKSFVESIAQAGSVNNKVLRLKRKNGESIWASVSANAHYDEKGKIDWIDGVIEDITERKRVEEALQEAHENLERLVEDRTAELSRKNRQLIEEIEERKRVEGQLRSSEEKYRNIYENIQDIYYESSIDGTIMEISPSVERMAKYTRNELIGKSVYDIYAYPDEREELLRVIREKGTITNYEVSMKDKDGNLYTASLCSRLVLDELGVPYKIVGTIRDVTERRKTEEALRASEERYRSVVDNIGIGISLISPTMEILTLNSQMKKWFPDIDTSQKPLCYKAFNNPPRESVCSYCQTYKTLQDGQVHECVTETPAGQETINYRIISSPIRDKDGKIIAAIEMVEDITESKKMQERLWESEAWYRTIFETTAAATVILEEDTTISLVNTEFEKLSGYSKEEMEGKRRWTEFVVQDDLARMQEYHRLRRIDSKAAPRNYEFRLISRDGRIRDAFLTIAIIPETTRSVASILDITKRKQAEAAARESEARLRALINNLPFEFWALDSSLRYIMQNIASLKNYGDVVGKRIEDIEMPAEVKAKWVAQDIKVLGGEILHEEYEREVEGEKKAYENFAAPVIVNEGVIGIVGVAIDVTARKRAEDALRESEKRLADIIDFLPDATFAIDIEKKVIAWNKAIEEMTGTKAEEILGKRDYEYSLPFYGSRKPLLIDLIFKDDQEIEKRYDYLQKEADVILGEADVPLKGGSRTLWGKARPLYDSKGSIVGAIQSIRDITERRRAEKALIKREKELEVKTRNLEELNTALKVLLKQREVDKDELEERTLSNVKHLILPYIDKLKKGSLEARDEAYIGIVESNLKDIVSPFSQRLSSKYMTFTPKELQVANLIKEGRTTKEIAELLNASPGTIDFHRNNIRNKLNLKNKRANLRSYLLTIA